MKTELYINDIQVGGIATAWEGLTARQYINTVKNLNRFTEENLLDAKMQLLLDISSIKWYRFFRAMKWSWRKPLQIKAFFIDQFASELMPIVDFVLQGKAFSKNLLPKINDKYLRTYYGPGDKLLNLSAEEFEKCEYFNAHWHDSQNIEHLQSLCGILYRKAHGDSSKIRDKRIEFNEEHINFYQENMKCVDIHILLAIHFWYEACLRTWQDEYKEIFPKRNNATEPILDAEAWRKILRALANGKMGNRKDVAKASLGDVYFELQQMELERIELDKLYKK